MDHQHADDGQASRVETELEAEQADVWRALTEPETMGVWLGRAVEFTLEPGAEGTIGGRDGDGVADDPTVLVVEEVDEERRLVFRWASATDPPTIVEFDLRPLGRRTHLTIVERPVRPGDVVGTSARACALSRAA